MRRFFNLKSKACSLLCIPLQAVEGIRTAFEKVVRAHQAQLQLKSQLSVLSLHGAFERIRFSYTNASFNRSPMVVKPCLIDGEKALIYHPQLAISCPTDYASLITVAAEQGWSLVKNRRKQSSKVDNDRRQRHLLLTIKVALSAIAFDASSVLAAENFNFFASHSSDSTVVRPLGLFSPTTNYFNQFETKSGVPVPSLLSVLTHTHQAQLLDYLADDYDDVLAVLRKKWTKNDDDPESLAGDIEQMARYIASRPDAYNLVMSIKRQPWSLHYRAGTYRSDIKGNAISVRSVKIYFDPRSAAKLKSNGACDVEIEQCVASPVDALLHEFLHAKLALLDTAEFIRNGGMNSITYPYRHERKVIALESEMYAAMSRHDNQPRPRRRTHSGHLVAASCVTCVGS